MSVEQTAPLRAALMARRAAPDPPLEARRLGFEQQMAAIPLPADFREDGRQISENCAALMCEVEGARADKVLLWLHGGAFILGSAASYRPMAARLSRATRAKVLMLDYRLAPENPFPAALEDSLAALDWLAAEGFSADDIAIGGDSAGANLAVASVQQRIARGQASPVAAVWLISAYLDLTHSGETIGTRGDRDPFVDPAGMPETAKRYLGDLDPADPSASPLFGSFTGFPPTLIQVGSDEVLFSDSARARDAIEAAGGRCVFQEWAGMIHVWPLFAHQIDEGGWAIEQGGAFIATVGMTAPDAA